MISNSSYVLINIRPLSGILQNRRSYPAGHKAGLHFTMFLCLSTISCISFYFHTIFRWFDPFILIKRSISIGDQDTPYAQQWLGIFAVQIPPVLLKQRTMMPGNTPSPQADIKIGYFFFILKVSLLIFLTNDHFITAFTTSR